MPETIFRLDRVEFAYPGTAPVVAGVDFGVRAGESIAFLGANASGKSTLLHLLDGLYFATSGTVDAFGVTLSEPILDRGVFAREFRRRVGYLFQNPDAQLFCPTVEEELAFGPLQLGLSGEEIRRRVGDISALCQLAPLLPRAPHRLSGGEKRRVALASVLVNDPSVLLLDEPTAGLDPRTESWLVDVLKALRAAGKTLLIATHDFHFATEIAERAIVLSEEHRIVRDGPVAEVVADSELLLRANLIRAHTHPDGIPPHVHAHQQNP